MSLLIQGFRWNDDMSDTGGQKLNSLFVDCKSLLRVFMDVSTYILYKSYKKIHLHDQNRFSPYT